MNIERKTATIADLPAFPLPKGETDESLFRSLCERGLAERYGDPIPQEARDRLDYEMRTIEKQGLARYFLIVREYLDWARSHDIGVGPGLNAASGSMAAYVLGITGIDPIEHGLVFELFINPERPSERIPYIIAGIESERFPEVRRHVASRYGEEALRTIFCYDWDWLTEGLTPWDRYGPSRSTWAIGMIRRTCRIVEERTGSHIDPDRIPFDDEAALLELRVNCEIKDYDLVPAKHFLEQSMIEHLPPRFSNVAAIGAITDGCKGETELASGYFNEALSIMYPEDDRRQREYEETGEIGTVLCSCEERVMPCRDERLQAVLGETLGIAVYDEQFARIAMCMCGFSAGKASELASGKGDAWKRHEQDWYEGAAHNGYPRETAQQLWKLFAQRMAWKTDAGKPVRRSKAAATGRAIVLMRAAYLKAHYPDDYRRALFTF